MSTTKHQVRRIMFIVYMILILTIISIKGFSQNTIHFMTCESAHPGLFDRFCKQKYKTAIMERTGFNAGNMTITTVATPHYYNSTLSSAVSVLHFFVTGDTYTTRLLPTLYSSDAGMKSMSAPSFRTASLSIHHSDDAAGTMEYQPGKFR